MNLGIPAADPLGKLMLAAQHGDHAAYQALLTEIGALVERTIRRRYRTLSREDVEDVVQDVLLTVHTARASYDSTKPFVPWVLAITRNRLADGARRSARKQKWEVAVDEYPETFDPDAANPLTEGYGDPEALRAALDRLPKGQRKVVEIVKLNERSFVEAASMTGKSVGALKVTSHRALNALRRMLMGKE